MPVRLRRRLGRCARSSSRSPTGSRRCVAELGDDAQVGFHGHENLALGVANSIARRSGRRRPDRRLAPAASARARATRRPRRSPPCATKLGIRTGIDVLQDVRRRRGRRPADHGRRVRPRPAVADHGLRGRLLELPQARATAPASATACPARRSSCGAGERKLVGGQEDQMIDIAARARRQSRRLIGSARITSAADAQRRRPPSGRWAGRTTRRAGAVPVSRRLLRLAATCVRDLLDGPEPRELPAKRARRRR